jgi:uncharacterized protein YjiS (DUF1127 family)
MKSVERFSLGLAMSGQPGLLGRVQSMAIDASEAQQPCRPAGMGHVFGRLLARRQRAANLRALAALSDRTLEDIGLTRADALRADDAPFWMIR